MAVASGRAALQHAVPTSTAAAEAEAAEVEAVGAEVEEA